MTEPAQIVEESVQRWTDEDRIRSTRQAARPFLSGGVRRVPAPSQTANDGLGVTIPTLDEERIIEPVFPTPARRPDTGHFVILQRWEGIVLEIRTDTFVALLVDKSGTRADEEAEIPIEELSRPDLDLLAEGAVFYWGVGYLDRPSGQRTRESMIRFRRLPAWSTKELTDAVARAEDLHARLSKQQS